MKRILSMVLVLILMATAFTATTFAEEATNVTLLRIGTTQSHSGFSIATSVGAFGRLNYNSFTRSNLLDVDENGVLMPGFLQTWELSEDAMSLTVTWPTNAKWHDGADVTAEDVEFTFDMLINVYKKKNYQSFELVDDHTGIIHFIEPASLSTLHSLTITSPLLYKHVFEGQDLTTFESTETTIGCGPFKFVSFDQDAQISYYEAFDGYFGAKPTIGKVEIRSFGSQETMMMALANDEIDAIYDYSNPVDPMLISLIEGNDAVDPGQCMNKSNYFYNFFSTKAPMDDVAFRKAAVYALDYEMLGSIVNGELAQPASLGMISPANRGFNDALPALEQDVQLAKDTLTEAGYVDLDGDGFVESPTGEAIDIRVTVQYGTRTDMYSRVAEVMINDWKAVGINCHFDDEAYGNQDVWGSRVKTPEYDVYVGVCTGTTTDFNTTFNYMLGSSTLAAGVHPGEEINAIFQNMLKSKTEEEYAEYCKQLQEYNTHEYVGAALCWDTAFYPYRVDEIDGWVYYPSWGVINAKTWFSLSAK